MPFYGSSLEIWMEDHCWLPAVGAPEVLPCGVAFRGVKADNKVLPAPIWAEIY